MPASVSSSDHDVRLRAAMAVHYGRYPEHIKPTPWASLNGFRRSECFRIADRVLAELGLR